MHAPILFATELCLEAVRVLMDLEECSGKSLENSDSMKFAQVTKLRPREIIPGQQNKGLE